MSATQLVAALAKGRRAARLTVGFCQKPAADPMATCRINDETNPI